MIPLRPLSASSLSVPVVGGICLHVLHIGNDIGSVLFAIGIVGDVGTTKAKAEYDHRAGQLQSHCTQQQTGRCPVSGGFRPSQGDDLDGWSVFFLYHDLFGPLFGQKQAAVNCANTGSCRESEQAANPKKTIMERMIRHWGRLDTP